MDPAILALVANQNSPDNNIRTSAELEFNSVAASDPSKVAYALVTIACLGDQPLDIKQASLLHLKRLVPKFWSIGFQLFVGPPIDQQLKTSIRENIVLLAVSSPQSKLRSAAAYVIVQIAAADFPDEWPDLLVTLYDHARDLTNHTAVVGSLAVLTDLFDDLITEDQFWEGGVGSQLIYYVSTLLSQPQLPSPIKTGALKLYLTVFNTLLSAEALESPVRKEAVTSHVREFSGLLGSLLDSVAPFSSTKLMLPDIQLVTYIYKAIAHIYSSFRKLLGKEALQNYALMILKEYSFACDAFVQFVVRAEYSADNVVATDDLDDPQRVLVLHISELLSTLSLLQSDVPLSTTFQPEVFSSFASCLVKCSVLPSDTVEEFMADFNVFVTDSSGLSASTTVREAIRDYVAEMCDSDATRLFDTIKNDTVAANADWKATEAYLFLAECLFSNEDADSVAADVPLAEYLAGINGQVSSHQQQPLVIARIFLLLPKFFEKFATKLSVNTFGASEFKNTYEFASSDVPMELFEIVKCGAILATNFWRQVPDFQLQQLGPELQQRIIEVAYSLFDDSEEDTPPVLMEAISVAIDINHSNAFKVVVGENYSVIDLILKTSFKDPSNVQLTIDSLECLQTLLGEMTMNDYLEVCQKLLPLVVQIISDAVSKAEVEFDPALYLALDMLSHIVKASPVEEGQDPSNVFPKDVFNYTFPPLRELLRRTVDDQILQNGGEVFNNLLQKASKLFLDYEDPVSKQSGMDILLEVAGKFLSPELSDSAAMNCGLIVMSLFEKFQEYFTEEFFFQLLAATLNRLVVAKEVVTIENLIMVFCQLVLQASPENLVNVLTTIEVDTKTAKKNGLQAILPIWFNAFEVTRGYEKIKQNVLALGKLYSLNDDRLKNIIVDGDLIPFDGDVIITRSMAKKMPEKYTQVAAPVKILKLLANELGFQCQQPDSNDYKLERTAEADEDDGEWEDLEDLGVPTYDKLRSYVDSDEEEEEEQTADQGIKEVLVQFFKECLGKNLGDFGAYYEALDDEEKKIITENVVF